MSASILRKHHPGGSIISTTARSQLLVLVTLLVSCPVAAQRAGDAHWSTWRGPTQNGVSSRGDPPISWSETENVRWKVKIEGRGLASPITWGDRVFLLSSVSVDEAAYAESQAAAAAVLERKEWPPAVHPVRQRFVVQARSRADGDLIWERTAVEQVPHESHYIESSFSSGSPVTDGEVLLAYFGSNGLFAFDLEGKPLWNVDLGDMQTRLGHGEGASPALFGDTVVVNWDHEGDSFVVALDKRTGQERWRKARPDEPTNWTTPLILESSRGPQVVIPATGRSRGYSLETGEELWSLGGMTVNVIPSPVHRDGVVFLASGYAGNMLQAVDIERASGALEGTPAVLWQYERDTPYIPSLLAYGDQLYFVKQFGNILTSLDARTGEVVFNQKRLPALRNVYASPVGAAGRVYLSGRNGATVVFAHGREFETLAVNVLDDVLDASPAVAGDELYLRGREYLYCIARDVPREASR